MTQTIGGGQTAFAWTAFKCVVGAVLYVFISTTILAVATVVLKAVPETYFKPFSPILYRLLPVVLANLIGGWVGAVAVKFVFPLAPVRAIMAVVGVFFVLAMLGWAIGPSRGDAMNWAALGSCAMAFIAAYLFLIQQWHDIPGRRPRLDQKQ